MKKPLRIAIVTDIHYGPDRYSKKGDEAIELLDIFVQKTNALKVDLVVDLGDRISNTDRDTDLNHLKNVSSLFQQLKVAHYHLIGNHDVVHMPISDQETVLNASLSHQSFDMSGWHLVFWSASCVLHGAAGFRLEQSDLDWLEADLKASTLPSVIFSHMPVDTGSMVGNYYFEKLESFINKNISAGSHYAIEKRAGKFVLWREPEQKWDVDDAQPEWIGEWTSQKPPQLEAFIKEFRIDPEKEEEIMPKTENRIRRDDAIRTEFTHLKKQGFKSGHIYRVLAEKFYLSPHRIRDIVSQNTEYRICQLIISFMKVFWLFINRTLYKFTSLYLCRPPCHREVIKNFKCCTNMSSNRVINTEILQMVFDLVKCRRLPFIGGTMDLDNLLQEFIKTDAINGSNCWAIFA